MTKNQKISKSLKSYHRNKRALKIAKKIFIFIAVVAWLNFIIGVQAKAPEARQWGLPQARDRELSVIEQIRQIAKEEGAGQYTNYLIKLSYCESRHDPLAVNDKGNNPADSIDRGLFQYNSYWQSQVSDECAFSVDCSTRQTIKMIEAGLQHRWVCDKYVKGVPLEVVMR